MRIRSYEFYEVRSQGDPGEEFATAIRGSYSRCKDWLDIHRPDVDEKNINLYLFRVQLVEAAKADKK